MGNNRSSESQVVQYLMTQNVHEMQNVLQIELQIDKKNRMKKLTNMCASRNHKHAANLKFAQRNELYM